MAFVPVALSVASTIANVVGGLTSSKAKAGTYQYQSGIANMNAKIAEQNRDYSIRAGESEAQQVGLKTGQMVGAQRARIAGKNLDINSGSPAQVQESQQFIGREDQATVRENAARRAWGHEVEAANFKAQANVYDTAAKNEKTAGKIGALSSFLGGATSVASKWMYASQVGLYGEGEGGGGGGKSKYYSG